MAVEPRAKNSNRLTPSIWRSYTEDERHHFNKLFIYLNRHQEAFNVGEWIDMKIWRLLCMRMSAYSTSVYKRGKRAGYWRRYKDDP